VSNGERTAGVMVQIYPAGSGSVLYEVVDIGPVTLTNEEIIRVLRSAADAMDGEK
jgi:hypothetical protein